MAEADMGFDRHLDGDHHQLGVAADVGLWNTALHSAGWPPGLEVEGGFHEKLMEEAVAASSRQP